MAAITRIEILNCRSFVDAAVDLSPVTLVVGANGSGKTNFLKLFQDLNGWQKSRSSVRLHGDNHEGNDIKLPPHFNAPREGGRVGLTRSSGTSVTGIREKPGKAIVMGKLDPAHSVRVFSPDPHAISRPEKTTPGAKVHPNGAGTTQVLESLRFGDSEERFDQIKELLSSYVPEIESLSFRIPSEDHKQIQVREKGIKEPIPADQLSEGTRIVLCLLTILYQGARPNLILLEDIDRAMHPRLFEQMVGLFRRLVEEEDVQIIATTHNPYLVDVFQDDPGAVVIVEKENGASTLSTLKERMAALGETPESPDDLPLGTLWFSGLVGGVPRIFSRHHDELSASSQ